MPDAVQVGIRLPLDLVRRADAYAAALGVEHPGLSFTRTDAIRLILAKHLPLLPPEVDEPAKPGPASKHSKPKPRP